MKDYIEESIDFSRKEIIMEVLSSELKGLQNIDENYTRIEK